MDYEYCKKIGGFIPVINKDWLKASSASLAKLQEVGTKVYNLDLADAKRLRVNKNNLLSRAQSNTSVAEDSAVKAGPLTTCAWGSNSSIPDLLRRQSERQKQAKARPESAKNYSRGQTTKTRTRPQSAKELGQDKNKRPPSGLGVKGTHRDLEERPPGGIGVGTGSGWTAPPGGVLDMTGAEIDSILSQVIESQRRPVQTAACHPGGAPGPPPPPRGSPDFSHLLNRKDPQGAEFGAIVDDLLFENGLPSHLLTRAPPPEPIHVTMPQATFDPEEGPVEGPDSASNTTTDNGDIPVGLSSAHNGRSKMSLDIDMNGECDDRATWCSTEELTDDEVHSNVTRGRQRTVTFNETKNETTLITPREGAAGRKPRRRYGNRNHDVESPDDISSEEEDEDVSPMHAGSRRGSDSTPASVPRPKPYVGKPELRWVKSRTDSGISSQEVAGRATRGNSATSKNRQAATSAATPEEKAGSVATVSVTYFDDLIPSEDQKDCDQEQQQQQKKTEKSQKKRHSLHDDNIETMVSKINLADENSSQAGISGSDPDNASQNTEIKWATPGSLKTKQVSSTQRNHYEQALQARLVRHRMTQGQRPDQQAWSHTDAAGEGIGRPVKTIKTLEFGDGEVVEHKMVSAVDAQPQVKKEYVLPKEARPHSASKAKVQEGSAKAQRTDISANHDLATKEDEPETNGMTRSTVDQRKHRPLSGCSATSRKPATSGTAKTSLRVSKDSLSTERPPSRQAFVENVLDKGDKLRDSGTSTVTSNTETAVSNGYAEFENAKRKPQRISSAPVRRGPTVQGGKLVVGGDRLLNSPYATPPSRPRPHSASVVSDMKKQMDGAKSKQIKISTKLSFKEIQRVKLAAKAAKKGKLSQPRVYNTEKYYANYTKPPPKPVVPVIRQKKKMAEYIMIQREQEAKNSAPVEIWTRQDDFEVETEGINECKKIQDKLLEEGVPVTLDTLTRALLPPGECALRGATYVTNNTRTLPNENARLLSKPSVWFPEEFNRLQRARKMAQRAEQSLKEQEWEDRNRTYMMSQLSGLSAKRKKKKKKKPQQTTASSSRGSSAIL